MQISVSTKCLKDAFLRIAPIVQKKSVTPVSSTVQLVMNNDGLVFTGKGNELIVQVDIAKEDFRLDEDIQEDVSVYIPADVFARLLQTMPSHMQNTLIMDIEDTGDGYTVTLLPPKDKKKQSSYKVNTNKEDSAFFNLPTMTGKPIAVSAQNLSTIIKDVAFAAAPDQYRLIFMGIKFLIENKKLTAVSTDSLRVAELVLDTDNINDDNEFLFYAKSLEGTKGVFDFDTTASPFEMTCGSDDSYVKFSQDNRSAYINLIGDCDFPDYNNKDLMPDIFPTEVDFVASDLKELLLPMSLLSDVSVSLSFSEDGIKVEASSSKGSSQDILENITWRPGSVAVDGLRMTISLLVEQLGKFGSDTITVKLVSDVRPMILSKDGYLQITSCLKPTTVEEEA